jgi:uncharacterized protein (DUF302 family)
MAAEGLVNIASKSGFQETLARLKEEIASRRLAHFAAIDHAEGAEEAGLALRPTTVLIFGNAKGGTPLMQANQTIGIDLPLRALVWEDGKGQTWISYNDPVWLAQRHALPAEAEKVARTLRQGLDGIVKSAAAGA